MRDHQCRGEFLLSEDSGVIQCSKRFSERIAGERAQSVMNCSVIPIVEYGSMCSQECLERSSYLVRHLSVINAEDAVHRHQGVFCCSSYRRATKRVFGEKLRFCPASRLRRHPDPAAHHGQRSTFSINKGLILTVLFLFSFPLPFSTHHHNTSMLH
jgi:hypothetical protein